MRLGTKSIGAACIYSAAAWVRAAAGGMYMCRAAAPPAPAAATSAGEIPATTRARDVQELRLLREEKEEV